MHEPEGPPTSDFFDWTRPAAGPCRFTLRLEPLEVEISGLDLALAEMLRGRYSLWAAESAVSAEALRVRLGLEDADYFIEPPPRSEPILVYVACDGEVIRYLSYQIAGRFDLADHTGTLLLSRGQWEPRVRSFENFIRVAVAWSAAERGGALVHAASAVRDGKGYLFYGESGAGKSTLSASNRRGIVLSDDLSLVLPSSTGELELIGTPFRGTYEGGPPIAGRFQLCGGFRLVQAPAADVRPVPHARALSEIVGNLPFVAEAFGKRPDLFQRALATFSKLPLAHLHFTKDDTFWDAIEAAGL